MKTVMRFGKKEKICSRFIGSLEILMKHSDVEYRLALLPYLSVVHPIFHLSIFKRYHLDDAHVI